LERFASIKQRTCCEKQILTPLRFLPKGAGKERIRAEMQQLIEDERLNEHEHIYTERKL
jgi:hypothetical protein